MSSSAGNLDIYDKIMAKIEKKYVSVYSRICGFKPTISDETSATMMETVSRAMTLPETAKEVEQLTQQLNSIIKEVDITMQAQPNPTNKVCSVILPSLAA